MTTSTMTYPHTSVQANIATLRQHLMDSDSPRRQERLDLLAEVEREYMLKRAWFTAVRAGNTNVQYPHTNVQANLARLRESLEDTQSPDAEARLELLDSIEQDYMRKRDWFVTLPTAAPNSNADSNAPAAAAAEPAATFAPAAFTTMSKTTDVRSMPGYPHTDITDNLSRLKSMVSDPDARQLVDQVKKDYFTKKEWYVKTIRSLNS